MLFDAKQQGEMQSWHNRKVSSQFLEAGTHHNTLPKQHSHTFNLYVICDNDASVESSFIYFMTVAASNIIIVSSHCTQQHTHTFDTYFVMAVSAIKSKWSH